MKKIDRSVRTCDSYMRNTITVEPLHKISRPFSPERIHVKRHYNKNTEAYILSGNRKYRKVVKLKIIKNNIAYAIIHTISHTLVAVQSFTFRASYFQKNFTLNVFYERLQYKFLTLYERLDESTREKILIVREEADVNIRCR